MITTADSRQQEMLAWAAERSGCFGYADDAQAIGRAGPDGWRAVVVFDTLTETTCHMHVASDGSRRWLTRELLKTCFGYAFKALDMKTVIGRVPASRRDAMMFDTHLGFRVIGTIPDGLPGDDLVILVMQRKDCRFIPAPWRV